MNEIGLADKVSDMAKVIVIAKMSDCRTEVSADGGKQVAEFYSEIYKGIYETLKEKLVSR